MLKECFKGSKITMAEMARRMDMDKSLFSRTVNCTVYRSRSFYKDLYEKILAYDGTAPMNGNIIAYPSGKDYGTWDIFVGEKFLTTLVFENYNDVISFVNKDERFIMIEKFFNKDTSFKNSLSNFEQNRKGK